jgi:hypothetical protein
MGNVKSENFWGGAEVGAYTRWIHIDTGQSGRTTIFPRTGETIILCNVVVNTSGSSGTTIFRDSKTGVIANLKSSIQEKDYHYQLPLKQGANLMIDNNSASDLTVMFINY